MTEMNFCCFSWKKIFSFENEAHSTCPWCSTHETLAFCASI